MTAQTKVNTSPTLSSSPGCASRPPLSALTLTLITLQTQRKLKGEEITQPQRPPLDARAARKQAFPHSQTHTLQWGAAQQTSISGTIISFSSSEASRCSALYASNPSLVPEMYQQNHARPDCGTDPDLKKKKKKKRKKKNTPHTFFPHTHTE